MTDHPAPTPASSLAVAPIPAAAWALAGAVAVLPFLSHLPIDFDRLAPLAILPAVWLGRRGPGAELNFKGDRIDRWLLTVAAAVALVSTAGSVHLFPALVHSATLLWGLAGALLARRLSRGPRSAAIVLGSITVGATAGCLAVWAGWKEGTPVGAFPHYGHARLFGLHLMIGTLTGLAWLSSTPEKTATRYAVMLVTICDCGGMLWSGGRTPIIGLAAGLVAWLWVIGPGRRRALVQRAAMVVTGGLLLSLLRWSPEPYLGWWGAVARSAAATSVDDLSSTRLSFWQAAWTEFLRSPWIGHGADAYRFIQPKLDGSQPHNWPLQLLLDFGVVGGVSMGILIVRQAWHGLFGRSDESAACELQRAAAAAFTACLFAGLLDGIFYHAVLLVPATLLAGLAAGRKAERRETIPTPPRRISNLILPVGLTASTAALAVHGCVVGFLLAARPPATPDAPAARLVQAFPSTTLGLTRWLHLWRTTRPEEALLWAKWAQFHSDDPSEWHVYVAVMYSNRGDFENAAREVADALRKCHVRSRPKLLELQKAIAAAQTQIGTFKPAPR